MNTQIITNVNDCVPLYLPHGLYLKPHARFNVSVSLPAKKLEKSISNLDMMDKLNSAIKPDKVLIMKVSKSTLEFVRFEGELEDRTKLRNVLARLDGMCLKMNGFSEPFKVRASEAKDEFPSRHDWDSFFRDARNMDEMKPGERPDTIHLSNLPIRWFCSRHMENDDSVKPSENIFRRIFEKFGSVRCVDIPICDVYRSQMKTEITGMKTFNFDHEVMFEGYVQFSEYMSFVKAMDEFRGMKLVRKLGDKNQAVNIVVTFDKTKHLSEASIKRRNIVRDRLIAKEKTKQEEELQKKKLEEENQERERKRQEEEKQKELELQRQREERRKEKHLKKLREKGQLDLTNKIRTEERKLLIAQRKLESLRVVEALFDRIKQKGASVKKYKDSVKKAKSLDSNDLRNKLACKYKSAQEELLNKQKSKLEEVKGKSGLLALIEGNKLRQSRSPSINTISSDDSVLSDSHLAGKGKKKKRKKEEAKESDPSISSSESEATKSKKELQPLNPFAALYNSEMAAEMIKQMTMYPYAAASMLPVMAAAAGMRPSFFPGPMAPRMPFPYRGGRFPRRGGGMRGIGGRRRDNFSYDSEQYMRYFRKTAGLRNGDFDDNDYYDEHDRRKSTSYSRSRSRSHSRSRSNHRYRNKNRGSPQRSRGRSRSRSRSRRSSKSRSRNRSHRKSHSRSKSPSKSKPKLVSTRRSRTEDSSSGWSRSRSKSRSRSWSQEHRGEKDSGPSRNSKIVLQPEKLVRSAKEIQRSVQLKLYERACGEEEKQRRDAEKPSTSKRRSTSIDSSKFISPKRKAPSITPEKEWEKT